MRINKLSPSRHKEGRWLICLENGDLLRVGENEVLSFSLYAGMDMDDETLEALKEAAESAKHKEYALNLLSARPLSRAELVRKLEEKECPEEAAQAIADRLEELGYLDDAAYARALAGHYSAKGYGPYKIRDELCRRGVPREYWEEALAGQEDRTERIDAFVAQKLRNIPQPDRKDLKRVSDALARRGFSWSDISAALGRYGAGMEE